MKKVFSALFIVIILVQVFSVSAFAADGIPIGSCAPGFVLHHFMEHDGEHMHTHIGITEDTNGDGYICMRVVSPTLHLHVDNVFPIQ